MTDITQVELRNLLAEALTEDMLLSFDNRQVITKKWVRGEDGWCLEDTYELREWDDKKRRWVPTYLREQVLRGGVCLGAYDGDRLAGFITVDGIISGKNAKYANLTMFFIDSGWKRRGIGKKLFFAVSESAKEIGAEKLFISAIPSYETVSFYTNLGCVDAEEIIDDFVDTEYDRYLEYKLV